MSTQSNPLFESATCSRCGGSGEYSYCSMYGKRCFKCGGRGWVLTKRGAAAAAKYRELLSKPASDLQPGDQIRVEGFNAGSYSQPTRWYTGKEVAVVTRELGSSMVDGVMKPFGPGLLEVICDGFSYAGVKPDHLFRVANTAEQKAEKLAIARAYQETLTKLGKPRKAAA